MIERDREFRDLPNATLSRDGATAMELKIDSVIAIGLICTEKIL